MMTARRWTGLGCGLLLLAGGAWAQPPETLEAALVRIAELEARVAELEARLADAGRETGRLEELAGLEVRNERSDAASAGSRKFTTRQRTLRRWRDRRRRWIRIWD